ncbi:MAG: hypothetical protein ACREIF_13070 [Chthoniobacterales bacterium]
MIDLRNIIASAGREPALYEVGLFTNQADIEHAQEKDRIKRINKKFLILQILLIRSKKTRRKRVTSSRALA